SDTNVKLQNAEACKVTRAEGQTDSVEDKCIILSEANDDLKKELSFVKGRVRKRDEGHAEILSHCDKASSDFSTDNKEALLSNSKVEMASNETVMDSTEAVRNINARQLKLFGLLFT
nr:WPP domain-interacting tail-anchored protein 1-like [Tanacetum cinerariifolium]